jgi:hypothetical protein
LSERRSVLLLCDDSRKHAGNVRQHISALSSLSQHDVYRFNPVDHPEAARRLDLEEFDAVVIHYSLAVWHQRYLSAELAEKLSLFTGLTVIFVQDEYRSVDLATARIRELGVDVLFSCVPPQTAPLVYRPGLPDVEIITTLPGYVPDELLGRNVQPLGGRPLDVGYRSRRVPFWLGRLGQEKTEIAVVFAARAGEHGLRCDISVREADRIYGEAWNRFLSSCRATLGTESGSSVVDFDGTLEARTNEYLARRPEASFEEVERDLLAPFDGKVVINTAAPRLFEAAALRTALVLFPGDYSGVVEPWTHYIPLEKDFSNLGEVAERIQDLPFLKELVDRTYRDLIESGRYSLHTLVRKFDELVTRRSVRSSRARKSAYRRAQLRRRLPSLSASSPLRMTAGRVLIPVVGLGFVLGDRSLRRVAAAGLVRSRVRQAGLVRDLVTLRALRNGVRRGAFAAEVDVDHDRSRLFISSRPNGAKQAPREYPGSHAFDEIVWRHAEQQPPRLAGDRLFAVEVGNHSFRALAELSRSDPRLVLEALEPVLRDRERHYA